jgi:ABC-type lipoprotein release transport system permease subunit
MVDRGRWLKRGDDGVVLGSWLAEDIGAQVGSVLSVECRGRGGFIQTFEAPIIGLVTADDPFINRNTVFMDLRAADSLLALDGAVTEYSFRIPDRADSAKTMSRIRASLPDTVTLHDWETLASVMLSLTKVKSGGSKVILLFMFILAAVGITNTMLMAVMERVGEIGMMRSLGYTGAWIRAAFAAEGFGIALIGGTAGLIAGCAINAWLAINGLDFSFFLRDMDAGYRIAGILRSAWHIPGITTAFFGAIGVSTLMAWLPTGGMLKREVADLLKNKGA